VSEAILERIHSGEVEPLYLVSGDRVAAEPVGERIARAVAEKIGCEVTTKRRPARLQEVLADLRTLSLFGPGKVVLVIESRVLADARDAAELIDDAGEVLPIAGDDLALDERRAAGRLLQALRLFQVDPHAGSAEEALEELPAWAFQGGSSYRRRSRNRPRGKPQVQELKKGLAELLRAARSAELQGWAETELAELSQLVEGGLPPQHTLILVEASVAADHPLVQSVEARGAWHRAGQVEATKRGGWEGLGGIVSELERETGVSIRQDALQELARRTLQKKDFRDGGGVKVDSTERLAGEYRKLASLAVDAGVIELVLVEQSVDDRGEEDVWKIIDDIGQGRAAEALHRVDRYMAAASDPMAARLGLFALLAQFAVHLSAIAGMARVEGVARGERNYQRFKSQLAPRLQANRPGHGKNPLHGLNPYRLHKAYLAASRLPAETLARLPARALEAELALKGGSRRPRAVLAAWVLELSGAAS
jgi:DNA polymerase III delta subunit